MHKSKGVNKRERERGEKGERGERGEGGGERRERGERGGEKGEALSNLVYNSTGITLRLIQAL